jgi:hypothetical protein
VVFVVLGTPLALLWALLGMEAVERWAGAGPA